MSDVQTKDGLVYSACDALQGLAALGIELPDGIYGWDWHDGTADQLHKCAEFIGQLPVKFDAENHVRRSMQVGLDTIGRLTPKNGRAKVYTDFAPLSFGWTAGGWVGGLIFHGAHDGGGDGGAPTFSVSLSGGTGWQIHT